MSEACSFRISALLFPAPAVLESKLIKAYEESHYCSSSYTVEGGKAHSHYCHRPFCPICQRIQTAQNVEKFLPIMKFLQNEGREFYFVTLTCRNCVTGHV